MSAIDRHRAGAVVVGLGYRAGYADGDPRVAQLAEEFGGLFKHADDAEVLAGVAIG